MNQENPEVEGVDIPTDDAGESDGGDLAPPKQLSNTIFIVIVVLLLGFQATSSILILGKLFAANPYFPGSLPVAETGPVDDSELYGIFHRLDGIIVNPTDSNGDNILLVDIGFETGSQAVVDELASLEPLLRDNINTFLAAQRLPVLTDISMREKIRGRIMEIVNWRLTSGQVGRVFFIRYVLQ